MSVAELVLLGFERWNQPRVRAALAAAFWAIGLILPIATMKSVFTALELEAHQILGGDARGVAGIAYGLGLFVYLFRLIPRLGGA